ncbi:MAG: hypothetical protein Fur0012_08880 [Elusimicrobiota bacterium]
MKEIRKLKLALTSSCTLNCNHCRIDKSSGLNMDFKMAKAGVDLLFSTPGDFKRLELYGGEPFLRFPLLKKISSYAREKSAKTGKNLSLSVATNATFLDDKALSWIKESQANISVSFSGSKESHDYNRKFVSGEGSHSLVLKNVNKLFEKIGPDYLVCLYCVDGAFSKKMKRDFELILKSGFRMINVECVSGRGWSSENYSAFEKGFKSILERIEEGIEKADFIFLEPFIEMISDRMSWDYSCPAYRDLEMYPDGYYGFYPYAFVDYAASRKKISVGKWSSGLNSRYSLCSPGCFSCQSCCSQYYTLPGLFDGSRAYELRSHLMKRFFFELLRRKKEKEIKAYLCELKRIRGITYV